MTSSLKALANLESIPQLRLNEKEQALTEKEKEQ